MIYECFDILWGKNNNVFCYNHEIKNEKSVESKKNELVVAEIINSIRDKLTDCLCGRWCFFVYQEVRKEQLVKQVPYNQRRE